MQTRTQEEDVAHPNVEAYMGKSRWLKLRNGEGHSDQREMVHYGVVFLFKVSTVAQWDSCVQLRLICQSFDDSKILPLECQAATVVQIAAVVIWFWQLHWHWILRSLVMMY